MKLICPKTARNAIRVKRQSLLVLDRLTSYFCVSVNIIFIYFQSSTRRKWTAGVRSITNMRAFSTASAGAGAEQRDSAADSGVGGSAEEVVEAVTIRAENQVAKL